MNAKQKLLLLGLCVMAHSVWATPGGLDANGCHHSKRVGYHCHTERGAKPVGIAPPQARTAEERRLTRECKGRPNAGACAGYAR